MSRTPSLIKLASDDEDPRVVVVGSGPSGTTAALALVERGIPVTLLESGRSFKAGLVVRALGRNIFRKWASKGEGYEFVATGDPQTEWLSSLAPGGLSNYWTGAVPRFAPQDFFEGQRLHEKFTWPLSYMDLAPYYTYAERLLGVVGEYRRIPQVSPPEALTEERHLPKRWGEVAASASSLDQGIWYAPIADGPRWTIRRSGAAFNSFEQLMPRLRGFPDFDVRLGAHAQRLTWDARAGRVDGVEYLERASGRSRHIRAKAVVLAAGPLASPKLLLQSASVDFPSGLGNSRDLLGRYLHDHPKDWCVLHLDKPLERLDQPLHVSRAPYDESSPLIAAALTIGPLSKWDRLLSLRGTTTKHFGLVTFATMLPEEHNRVRLHPQKRDRFGMPLLEIDIRFRPEVGATIASSHDRFRTLLARAGIRATIDCPVEKLAPGWAAHYGGAVRMHASPEYGVLDAWNRVHGVPNVAVVDASSFTTAVEKNPTLTIMALAARAANRLADDLTMTGGEPSTTFRDAVPSLR